MRLVRRDLQIVFQDPLHALNPRRTVSENVARPLLNFGATRSSALDRVEELLEIVGLNPAHANRYPHEFSGGQCQRVGIARALALNPKFLFLDEPVSALDVSVQAQILNLLKELQEKLNLTYLFVTHDLKIVKHISDRIMVLYHGRTVEIGNNDDIYVNSVHPYSRALLDSVLSIDGGNSWEYAALKGKDDIDDGTRTEEIRDRDQTRLYLLRCLPGALRSVRRAFAPAEGHQSGPFGRVPSLRRDCSRGRAISMRQACASAHRQLGKILARGVVLSAIAVATIALWPASPLKAADAKTIVMAIEGEPGQLDPHTHALWLTYREVYLMFESFVQQDLSVKDVSIPPIIPALATSWDISDDKKTYTFHLREGVKFHDGTPWNAEAAKFNFDRVLDKNFQYFSQTANSFNGWWTQDIESYSAVDPSTFEVKLKQPNSEFLRRMAQGGFGSAGMLSPEALKKSGNDNFSLHPIGTGPFKFVERVVGEKIVLERNPDYWDERRKPKIDRLIIRGIPEVATRELALLTGEVDIIATPSPDSVDYLRSQGITVEIGPVPTIYLMWVNFRQKPLDDAKVRKALYMAIDRESLCKFLRKDQCLPAYSVLNFGGPGYDPKYNPMPYDPEKAKQLLAEAGYPDGFEIRVDWTSGGAGDVNTVADAEWI